MYYDRFGRPLAPSTPCDAVAPPPRRAPSGLLKQYLDAHRTVWHLESLREIHPEIVAYLEGRYAAARDTRELRVRAIDGSLPDLSFDQDDPCRVAEALLSREYRHALFEERISPSIDRLTA